MSYQHAQGVYFTDSREDGLQHVHHFVGSMSENSLAGMDEIDPSLIDISFPQHNFPYQQTFHSSEQQQPLQRYIGESDQMGPLRSSQMYQRSISNTVASVPHASVRMDSPTPSMYSHGITATSSANSPVDDRDLMYDPAMYSPSTNYGFQNTYLPQAHSGSHFLHDLELGGESTIPQYSLPPNAFNHNCVNMSQVQNYADYGLDEGYSMPGGGGNEFIEVDHSSMKLEGGGNSYRYSGDEGLGTSIPDESSQRAAATPMTSTHDFDADADDDVSVAASPASDTDYTPKSKSTRATSLRKGKRSRDSFDSASTIRVSSKRARTTKSTTSPSNMKMPTYHSKHNSSTHCTSCPESFTSQTLLSKHVLKEHTKAFVCVFSFAACNSVFATKNEWKRHVFSQHCNFNTWICDIGECAKPHAKGKGAASAGGLGGGAHFNRKDLYTQHLRRMHTPRQAEKGGKGSVAALSWDERIRALQETNCHQTRSMPEELNCPVASCTMTFSGKNTWDERMEHVGKHLEGVAQARGKAMLGANGAMAKPVEEFDQGNDELLVDWAVREGIVVPDPVGEGYCFAGDAQKRRLEVLASGNGEIERGVDSEDDAECEDE